MTRTKMVCHRGASRLAPENTMASAEKALELGAAFIELDIRESADGQLYVLHDRTVDRTTDGRGEIAFMSANEIDRLDAGTWFGPAFAGERVPRLDVFLENLKGRAGAYTEIKWCDPVKFVRLIRDLDMVEDIFYFSFKPQMRNAVREVAPEFRQMITADIARSPSMAKSFFGAAMIELEVSEATPVMLAASREAGLEIMVYYAGSDPGTFDAIACMGVDYINLDHPEFYAAAEARISV